MVRLFGVFPDVINILCTAAPNGHEVGLRNRRNGEATTNGHGETTNNTVAQSAVTDLERTTSLRGILEFRKGKKNQKINFGKLSLRYHSVAESRPERKASR